MYWKVYDIHAAAAEQDSSSVKVGGVWAFSGASCVTLVNATSNAMAVGNVPNTLICPALVGDTAVATSVHTGACSVVNGLGTVPWAVRLEKLLQACEDCQTACIAVIDPPPTGEISSSRVAFEFLRKRLDALKGSEKLVVLAYHSGIVYPTIESCADGGLSMTYSQEPWDKLFDAPEWGMRAHMLDKGNGRFQDTLSLLLGSYAQGHTTCVSTAKFPANHVLAKEMLKHIVFSDNVVPGSGRASTTRGVTACTTDGKPWHATVVLEGHDDTVDETEQMRELRTMLTSPDKREAGGAYFMLHSMGPALPDFVRTALKAYTSSTVGNHSGPPFTVPLCRAASVHRAWT